MEQVQGGTGGDRRTTALAGRGRERREVRAAVRAGRPVVITGPRGVGRTALARAAVDATPVAWGGGLVTIMRRPFLALERALAEEAPDAGVERVAAWAASRLAGRVLVVDDLHLAHPATAAVLGRLAGTVPLVATIASDDRRGAGLHHATVCWRGDPAVVDLAPFARESRLRAGMPDSREARPGREATPRIVTGLRARLTQREAEVLGLVAGGHTTLQIARTLGIAPNTVESHVRSVRTKLGVPTRMAAAAWAS
ncbi:MAG TPA: LuxR C-terminal-related transcriptional regulator [Acidimicrobiales bacterium]|nr:LuxR C-terminal-related transcriptional regulator [Acidimicrobiales bacterium]